MRHAYLLVTLSAAVLAGCTSSRAGRFASAPGYGPGTVVHVSEVYSEAQPWTADGEIVGVSEVYYDAPGASDGTATLTTFLPPPPPRLPAAEARAPTTCVPAARPAPARPVCVPTCKPPSSPCVGGNCGIPDPCDPCPGGNCGVPSLDACAPPLPEFDPCKK